MKNLNEMTGPQLTAYYNELTGKSIKKFSTKKLGIKAIEKVLPTVDDKPAKKNAQSNNERTVQVLDVLRKKEMTVADLMEMFSTKYKNITGDLFDIRKGRGVDLTEGEEVVRRREGLKNFYSIIVVPV